MPISKVRKESVSISEARAENLEWALTIDLRGSASSLEVNLATPFFTASSESRLPNAVLTLHSVTVLDAFLVHSMISI